MSLAAEFIETNDVPVTFPTRFALPQGAPLSVFLAAALHAPLYEGDHRSLTDLLLEIDVLPNAGMPWEDVVDAMGDNGTIEKLKNALIEIFNRFYEAPAEALNQSAAFVASLPLHYNTMKHYTMAIEAWKEGNVTGVHEHLSQAVREQNVYSHTNEPVSGRCLVPSLFRRPRDYAILGIINTTGTVRDAINAFFLVEALLDMRAPDRDKPGYRIVA